MDKVPTVSILVVDDSQPVRDTIRAMLGMVPGCQVVGEAADGPGAVETALRLKPDVVLMDINLPGCDGLAAAEQILQATPTRIIVISVENGREYFRRALQAGACDFLVKPFTPESLAEAIQRARAPAEPAAAEQPAQPLLVAGAQGGVGASSLAVQLAARAAGVPGPGDHRAPSLDFAPRVALAAWGESLAALELLLGEHQPVPLLPFSDEDVVRKAAAWDLVVVDAGRMPPERLPAAAPLVVVLEPTVPSLHGAVRYRRANAEPPLFVLNRAGCAGSLPPAAVAKALDAPLAAVLPEDAAVREAANLGLVADLRRGPWSEAVGALAQQLGLMAGQAHSASHPRSLRGLLRTAAG